MKVLVKLQSLELSSHLHKVLDGVEIDDARQLLDMEHQPEDAVLVGAPEEEIDRGCVLICVGPVVLEFDATELARGLRPFVRKNG